MNKNSIRRRRSVLIPISIIVMSALSVSAPANAQTANGLYLAGATAFALQPDDLIGTAALGAQIGYRFPGSFLILGEYLYAGTDYYYYDNDDQRWTMAASWSEVPSGFSSRRDWLFYRTRHAFGLAAGASGRFRDFGFFGAAGIMLSFIDVSDAQDYYPEFAAVAERSSIGDGSVLVTITLRGGLVYPANSLIAGQLAYLVQIENTEEFDERRYLRRNSLVYLGLVLQTGGGR